MAELLDYSALDLSKLLASSRISAEDLMRATLARIDAVNGDLNAIVSLRDRETLVAEAREAGRVPRKGWLHGMPIAIKDLANAVGFPTSKGSPIFAGQVADKDDLMVARLRAAGAIVIGKTNTPEFGLGSHTFNPVFGATRNPYDPKMSCGGSSGGAAVAVSCRMLAVADGSDMMGSLRNPAAWNNIYGMRPSVGLVPREPGEDLFLDHLSTLGPMARNPRDLSALLDTMAGPDPRVPFGMSLPMTLPAIEAEITGRRIGWLGDWGGAYAFEPGILDLCVAALAQMEDLGLVVEPLDPPHPAEPIWEAWTGLRNFANACRLQPLYSNAATRERLKDAALWEIRRGLDLSASDVYRLSCLRSQWFLRAAEVFEKFDALILPSTQVWPFPLEQEYPSEIMGRRMDTYHRWMEVVVPASLIGLPVVNLPVGFGENGLPMGVQLIGPRGADGRLLQIAQAWHDAADWPARRPPPI